MRFDVRPIFDRELGRDFGQRNHAMRVADGRGAIGEFAIENLDFLIDHFTRGAAHVNGNFRAIKADAAHRHRDQSSFFLDHRFNLAAGRFDSESRVLYQPLIPEETREDAQPIT
jgi:hypothetical protein